MRIEEFLRTKPEPARKAYRPRLEAVNRFLSTKNKTIEQIDQGDFREHVSGYASETSAQTLGLIRQYGRFDDWPDNHPIFDPLLRIRKLRPRKLSYVDQDSYGLMLGVQDNTTVRGVYQIAFLMAMFDTGARIAEMARIEMQDVDFEHEVVTLRRKGGDWDPTPVTSGTFANLQPWLLERRGLMKRRGQTHDYLFPAIGGRRSGSPLTAGGAGSMVRNIARSVGLKLTAHSFRRGLTIWMYLEGGTRPQIIEHLGWRDGRMLDHYIRHLVVDEDVRKILPGNMLEVHTVQQRADVENPKIHFEKLNTP